MKPFAKSLLAVSISALLFGCGGGDSTDNSGTPSTDDGGTDNPPVTTVQLKVQAIDGVLKGARVWVDLNRNGLQDEQEPTGTSDDRGQVLFTLTEEQGNAPIYVMAIPGETEDLERGPIETAFTLAAPANSGTVRVVSPLTTLLFLEIAKTSDPAQARVALANRLGIDPDMLESNFIEQDNGLVAFIAKSIVDALPATGLPIDATKQETMRLMLNASASDAAAIYVKLGSVHEGAEGLPTLKREIDYNTHQIVFSVEFATRKVVDGKAVSQGIKYYWDSMANDYERLNGDPLVATVWTLEERQLGDGTIERHSTWEKDLNKDGVRHFKGQLLSLGTSEHWTEYYDEGSNCDESAVGCVDNGRHYDNTDLRAALAAKDYSTIDFVQVSDKMAVTGGHDIKMVEYTPDAPTQDWFKPLSPGTAGYSRLEHRVTDSEGTRVIFEHDWHADGSINQRESLLTRLDGSTRFASGKIVWANPLGDEFEEYADYNTFGPTRTSYWYDTVTDRIHTGVNLQTLTIEGKRYLLDEDNQIKLSDSAHPEGYLFNQYRVEQQDISADERHIYVTWDHRVQQGYEALNQDSSGQEFKVMLRHKGTGDAMDGWWIGHDFAEWNSREIADLPDKILSLRAQGVSFGQINADNLPGLSIYDQAALDGPLFKTGTKRYLVTNDSWLGGSGTQKLTFNGMLIDDPDQDLLLHLDGGMMSLVLLKGNEPTPCTWWTCWEQRFSQIDTINPVKGIVTFRHGVDDPTTTLYLREEDADAALATP
ncbi:hypothetical protein [Aeromonas sp. FDAARGOS 1415]|uniref:hypothetical protein n=1 Tax=Aeromonas TaxID=642 RepID=UPI001C22F856|nr:hypothetical protein [Aeromonas sp. FDAARGOS 1415]QXB54421.1 hypothetical protein I6L45_18000 [Aeromonas sp. FDAARGOS 1415]